jgi:hypothetical protein
MLRHSAQHPKRTEQSGLIFRETRQRWWRHAAGDIGSAEWRRRPRPVAATTSNLYRLADLSTDILGDTGPTDPTPMTSARR